MVLTYKQKFNKKYGNPINKPNSIKEISEKTGYKLSGLKTIFLKGKGAYKTNPHSVRPNINSPEQWAYSSINNRNIFNYDYVIVDYCMYNHPVKKPTIFYNNFNLDLKRCDKKHTHTKWRDYASGTSPIEERYMFPEELCNEILKQVEFYYIHII